MEGMPLLTEAAQNCRHYSDVIMNMMASQITSLPVVYSTVYPGADQRKHQRPALLAFVRGIHRWPVNSPHKGPVTWKMIPFDDVIMEIALYKRPPYQIRYSETELWNAETIVLHLAIIYEELRIFTNRAVSPASIFVNRFWPINCSAYHMIRGLPFPLFTFTKNVTRRLAQP